PRRTFATTSNTIPRRKSSISFSRSIRPSAPASPAAFKPRTSWFCIFCGSACRGFPCSFWKPNLVNVIPAQTVAEQESELGVLYRDDPTRCCQLRKVDPLLRALEPFETWFTGLRREQSITRKHLKKAELHRLPAGKVLTKVNPLADWSWGQVWEYTGKHGLSYLPQYDLGYLSIGCEPCTAVPEDPANPRSGRWGGRKLECGIHTFSERSQ